jgi:hypothetical protein
LTLDSSLNYTQEQLIENLKFEKCFLFLEKNLKKITFERNYSIKSILLADIESLKISKKTEAAIIQCKYTDQFSSTSNNNQKQSGLSKLYLFNLILKNKSQMEILINSAEDFKLWTKNLNYVINNQYKIPFLQDRIY